jgi:hypothetical protein
MFCFWIVPELLGFVQNTDGHRMVEYSDTFDKKALKRVNAR